MLNRLIGKNVEIKVAFSAYMHQSGSLPATYYGILREVDDEFCLLSLTYMKGPGLMGGTDCRGDMYIKKAYIVTCWELQA